MQNEDTKKVVKHLLSISSPDEARTLLAFRGHDCISKSMLRKANDARKNTQNKSVNVEIEKSVRWGDKKCQIRIDIKSEPDNYR